MTSPFYHTDPAGIPAYPGAYGLVIVLDRPLGVTLPRKPETVLPPGRYVYCGSAKGPGGLRARLGRHMRVGKALRWHVDRLTEAGRVVGAWVFLDGAECALVAALEGAGLRFPVAGFGASDCPSCPSHLLAWPEGATLPWRLGL